jgi:hypothetical protein
MVCRLVLIGERACYCVNCDWHTYVDDVCSACWQWIGVVPSPWSKRFIDESKYIGAIAVDVNSPPSYGMVCRKALRSVIYPFLLMIKIIKLEPIVLILVVGWIF